MVQVNMIKDYKVKNITYCYTYKSRKLPFKEKLRNINYTEGGLYEKNYYFNYMLNCGITRLCQG